MNETTQAVIIAALLASAAICSVLKRAFNTLPELWLTAASGVFCLVATLFAVINAMPLMLLFAATAFSVLILLIGDGKTENSEDKKARRRPKKKEEASSYLAVILVAVILLLPSLLLICGAFVYPPQYSNSYLGALPLKTARLDSAGNGKLVVIGGSSVAFGLNSKLLGEICERETVNYGLYATLGTEVMTELAKSSVGEGDIVIIAPETDRQTMSDYFGAEAVLQATDGNADLLLRLPTRYLSKLAAAFYPYASGKLANGFGYSYPASGIYGSASFNEYGDISAPRPQNTMPLGVDGTRSITLSPELTDAAFIDYLNSFAEYLQKKGAKLYFSFPPMNSAAMKPSEQIKNAMPDIAKTEQVLYDAQAYYNFLSLNLKFPVITDPSECILGAGYFFDTNYHLNDSGVTVNTVRLAADILRAEGISKTISAELPEEPALPEKDDPASQSDSKDNGDSALFLYESYGPGLIIVGVTDEAKSRSSLTVPRTYDGKTVIALGSCALSGCNELIELTVNDNIVQFADGSFSGCRSLKRIYMNFENADLITVGEELFAGAPSDAMLYMNESSLESFAGNYSWYAYSSKMKVIK